MHNKKKGRGAAIFCLSICLALLFSAILISSPALQKQAAASLENPQQNTAPETQKAAERQTTKTAGAEPAKTKTPPSSWAPLLERLDKDKIYAADVDEWFARMPNDFSARPMGVKVTALFKARFMPPYFPYFDKPTAPSNIYDGVVSQGNIQKCYDFLRTHEETFKKAEAKYLVPKEILVSLLMVETRLGNFMGSEHAFWSLACMANSSDPANIASYLEKLPLTDEHSGWLSDILKARSDWAYAELKALILYCRQYGHDPLQITGSIYGAIGLCQFMPSNIPYYAADGNDDGKIDLFVLEDAVHSAANFLKLHGWTKDTTGQKQVKLLRYYNHSTAYANTIIGMADGVIEMSKSNANSTAESKKVSSPKKLAKNP